MNILEENGVIHKTKNYDQFTILNENRSIDKNHVKNLAESIETNNSLHLHPIICTKDLKVIDGQHRLKAAEKLNFPIYYIIDENYKPEKIILFNSKVKKWVPADYLNYWVVFGKEDYLKLNDFMKDIGFELDILLSWINRNNTYRDFKSGELKFDLNEETLNAMLATKQLISFIKEKQKNYKRICTRQFHMACKSFFNNNVVQHEDFFHKLNLYPYPISVLYHKNQYIDELVKIYNYKSSSNRVVVAYDGNKTFFYD